MTTSKRGGVTLDVDGKEYAVRVSTNAMVRYQDRAGETFVDGLNALQNATTDIRRARDLFWAALVGDFSVEDAGDLMDEAGIEVAMAKLSEATVLAFPQGDSEGNGEAGKPARKTK